MHVEAPRYEDTDWPQTLSLPEQRYLESRAAQLEIRTVIIYLRLRHSAVE